MTSPSSSRSAAADRRAGPRATVVLAHRPVPDVPSALPLHLRRQVADRAGHLPVVRHLDPRGAGVLPRPQALRPAVARRNCCSSSTSTGTAAAIRRSRGTSSCGLPAGQDVLRRYHRRVGDDYRPAAETEEWFELPIDDAPSWWAASTASTSTTAATSGSWTTRPASCVTSTAVKRSLQLAIYALACEHLYGRLPATVSLDFVVAGTEVGSRSRTSTWSPPARRWSTRPRQCWTERYEPTPMRLCDWCDHRALPRLGRAGAGRLRARRGPTAPVAAAGRTRRGRVARPRGSRESRPPATAGPRRRSGRVRPARRRGCPHGKR